MMWRGWLRVTAVGLGISLLVGCASGGGDSGGESSPPPEDAAPEDAAPESGEPDDAGVDEPFMAGEQEEDSNH